MNKHVFYADDNKLFDVHFNILIRILGLWGGLFNKASHEAYAYFYRFLKCSETVRDTQRKISQATNCNKNKTNHHNQQKACKKRRQVIGIVK